MKTPAALNHTQPDRGQRRYFVSDERMQAFAKLTPLERLIWVEECSAFVRMGQKALRQHKQRTFEK